LTIEPIFIILGINELNDMARTGANIIGNCLASAVVAKMEGELDCENAKSFE
jgi:proton glutamate symport protein